MSRYLTCEGRSPLLRRDRFFKERSPSQFHQNSVRSVVTQPDQSHTSRPRRSRSPIQRPRERHQDVTTSTRQPVPSSSRSAERHLHITSHRDPSSSSLHDNDSSRRVLTDAASFPSSSRIVSTLSVFDRLDGSSSKPSHSSCSSRRIALVVDPQSPYIVHPHEDARSSPELQKRNLIEFQSKLSSLRQGYTSYDTDDSASPSTLFTVQIPVTEFPRSVTHGHGDRGRRGKHDSRYVPTRGGSYLH